MDSLYIIYIMTLWALYHYQTFFFFLIDLFII